MKRTYLIFFLVLLVTSVVVVGYALYDSYWGAEKPSHIDVDRRSYPVKGIDVSSHNGVIDFDSVAGDTVSFVLIKASEGAFFRDSLFGRNYDGARAAGLKVGAYHFFRFDRDGRSQAVNFLRAVGNRRPDFPLVIDIEEWGNPSDEETDAILDRLLVMISTLHSKGRRVMLYTNKNGYNRFVHLHLDRLPLWVCSFTMPPVDEPGTGRWTLWQHSHRGHVAGVSGPVDLNTFNGTEQQFVQWLEEYTPLKIDHSDTINNDSIR